MNDFNLTSNMLQYITMNTTRLKEICDYFPLGVIITNREGLIVYYNTAHAKLDDMSPEDVLGLPEAEVLAPIVGPNIMNICQKTAQPILGYIFPYRTPKGKIVNAAYWVFPLFEDNANKIVKGAICFTQPLLGELGQTRAYNNQPSQWPGVVPINMPQKNIVGANPLFQKAMHLAVNCANTPFPILIAGETGSGKEMMAKLVHRASYRRNKPYMALNCSAIPGQLLEGLLFGTTKGSFTGAIDRAGLFEEANGGCLYLDEIDSMPLELQPKLLRIIQEMKVCRVGSTHETKLDIKLISSIGSHPQKALNDGRLRADLFYRLAVVVVNVPPLRERFDDMELLIDYFINKYNNLLGKSALKMAPDLFNALNAYDWPGNVRELEHFIAGALSLVKEENIIGMEHIPEHYKELFEHPVTFNKIPHKSLEENLTPSAVPLDDYATNLDAFSAANQARQLVMEEERLKQAMITAGGNITLAAQSIGISRQLLSYRLMKFGLNKKQFKK